MAAALGPPRCSLLFADSFHHDRLCQHVDEVRFKEPVIISACEIVELHQSSRCPTLDLKGTTSPESCALEIYVRSGRDSRFQRLGPAFIHSPAATSFLDVQAAVTEHLVLRGSYKSLSLVIYGSLASELSLENKLDTKDPARGILTSDSLSKVLRAQPPKTLTLSNLNLLSPLTLEQKNLLQRLINCVGRVDATHHLVSMLLTAAAAWYLSSQRQRKGAQWFTLKKLDLVDGCKCVLDDDPVQDLSELDDFIHQQEDKSKLMPSNDTNGEILVRLSQHWLQAGLEPFSGTNPSLSAVESLIGGLAAVQLLCSSCPEDTRAFIDAGGMRLLHQVVEEVSGTTALLLFALTSVECLIRHGYACEAFSDEGKKILLTLLDDKQRPPVKDLLHQILQRLECYELSVRFGQMAKLSTHSDSDADPETEDAMVIEEATKSLNDLLDLLSIKGPGERESAEQNWTKRDLELPNGNGSVHYEFRSPPQDIEPTLLSVLQETRFMASLAAFSSTPYFWSETGSLYIEFAFTTQCLLLRLLECRSGLLFLSGDMESLMTLISGLKSASVQELEPVPIRHIAMLSSLGYLCTSSWIAEAIQSRMAMVIAVDRVIGADMGSEAAYGALWDLASMSRSEAGRQAILALVSFPEVVKTLVKAIHPSPDPEQIVGRTAGHFAAEVLQKVLCDSALTNQIGLAAHALTLQTALQAAYNTGMRTLSKLVEWVEAAVVYKTKGALGLLKHAGALIGPQNPSATMHVDGSMDDDANNLHDRAPASELPNSSSKGLGPAVIQDSAVHALSISMRFLASAGWNMEVAALLYGDGAMGVVNVILEHCVTALQTSSSEYDDEEAEEEEGRGEELHKEQALVALLLPTLLLLLSLLKCLQGVLPHYCSTRLLDLLTQLHHVVCAKAGVYGTIPPYSWKGGQLELRSVQQVLVSLLAFWPVLNWSPALLPRLLGPSSTSMPLEPGEACSVIWLLEEFLLPEQPRLKMDKAAVSDVCRSVGIGNIQGLDVMAAVRWHTSSIYSEKMLHALYPYFEQIGQLVVRLVPCKCDAVQERLANLVIRLACQSPENAAVLVRPVLLLLQQRTAAAAKSLLSETDVIQGTHMLRWVTLLAAHPSSKAVLLQEGAVGMLLQILSLDAMSSAPVGRLGWLVCSFRAVSLLCDTTVSFSPTESFLRPLSEDCPTFSDCCALASSLLRHCQVMQIALRTEVLADALEKLASHDVGRTALASVALDNVGCATPMSNQDTPESQMPLAVDKDKLPFLKLWQNFASALEAVELNLNQPLLLSLIRRFAQAANVLTDSDRSSVGVVALKALFGLDYETSRLKAVGVQDDKLEVLSRISSILEHIPEVDVSNISSGSTKSSSQEALSAVSSMLRSLKAPVKYYPSTKSFILHEEIRTLLARLPAARPIAERRAEAVAAQKLSPCLGLISSAAFVEEMNLMDMDLRNSSGETKDTIPWDCPKPLQELPVVQVRTLKRRVISTIEVASKRSRGDVSGSAVASRTTVQVTSSRRDTFRLRKPNTSRPPSMHVDDYVAREKSSDVSNPATLATPLQRSNSGSERAPSVHVDEFIARQRDHQQSTAPPGAQSHAENGGRKVVPDGAYDGAELETDGNLRTVQTSSEYSNVNISGSGVATFSPAPPAFGTMNTSSMNMEFAKVPEPLQRTIIPLSVSEHPTFPLQRTESFKMEQNNGVQFQSSTQPPALVKVKLERTPSTNSASAAPPSPFRPYDQDINATGGPAVKKEPWHQTERNSFLLRTSHGETPTVSNFSTSHNAPVQQPPHTDIVSHHPPPPPAPPSPWSDAPRRLDSSLLPPAVPRLIPGMNVVPFNHGTGPRPPADLQVGGVVLQPPAGLWRDSPTVFSGLPPPAPPVPGPIQHGPVYVQQPYVAASRPQETLPAYPANHAAGASARGIRYANFGGPQPGQGSSSVFQPPAPTVIAPPQIPIHLEQSVHHPPPLYLPEPDISAQQEPGAVLQQILQSPDTIQELLKDPKKLQQLLEQHPKLITLLQAHLS